MDINDAKQRVKELREQIAYHSNLYYNYDAPVISDFEYDMLFEELKTLEASHPELDDPLSPTHRVGGAASSKFSPVSHRVRMGSLTDVFSIEEAASFVRRAKERLLEEGERDITFTVEPKIDGLSVSLMYERGRLVCGATRGDGLTGEDVTENIMTIRSIPRSISLDTPELCVRGEVYMPRASFEKLNAERFIGSRCRKNLHSIASYSEGTAVEVHIISGKLNIYKLPYNIIPVLLHTRAQRHGHVLIVDGRAETVDAGYT